jgi:MFS family permease
VLVTIIGTLVTPIVASNTPLLLAVRVLEGFGEGVTFPAMHAMLTKWGPPLERSKLATLCYSGTRAWLAFLPVCACSHACVCQVRSLAQSSPCQSLESSPTMTSLVRNDIAQYGLCHVRIPLIPTPMTGGWPAVFYVFGALGLVWFAGWMALTSDSPAKLDLDLELL